MYKDIKFDVTKHVTVIGAFGNERKTIGKIKVPIERRDGGKYEIDMFIVERSSDHPIILGTSSLKDLDWALVDKITKIEVEFEKVDEDTEVKNVISSGNMIIKPKILGLVKVKANGKNSGKSVYSICSLSANKATVKDRQKNFLNPEAQLVTEAEKKIYWKKKVETKKAVEKEDLKERENEPGVLKERIMSRMWKDFMEFYVLYRRYREVISSGDNKLLEFLCEKGKSDFQSDYGDKAARTIYSGNIRESKDRSQRTDILEDKLETCCGFKDDDGKKMLELWKLIMEFLKNCGDDYEKRFCCGDEAREMVIKDIFNGENGVEKKVLLDCYGN